jgi:hypothetical protein
VHDDDGLAAQGRVFLLLTRRKEGAEIEEQPSNRAIGRLRVHHGSIRRRQESTSPTVPPRYAFRLKDLRIFHLVRELSRLRAQIDHSERNAAAGPPRLYTAHVA